jgi:multidrug resistance efflux pump
MIDTNDDDANTREVLAGLRAQLAAAERERETLNAEVMRVRAELDALKLALERISQAWRYVVKQLA